MILKAVEPRKPPGGWQRSRFVRKPGLDPGLGMIARNSPGYMTACRAEASMLAGIELFTLLAADGASALANRFLRVFLFLWCGMALLAVVQVAVAITAMVQILQRDMPTDQKILWTALVWFVPVIGYVLWWTIEAKQSTTGPRPPRFPDQM